LGGLSHQGKTRAGRSGARRLADTQFERAVNNASAPGRGGIFFSLYFPWPMVAEIIEIHPIDNGSAAASATWASKDVQLSLQA